MSPLAQSAPQTARDAAPRPTPRQPVEQPARRLRTPPRLESAIAPIYADLFVIVPLLAWAVARAPQSIETLALVGTCVALPGMLFLLRAYRVGAASRWSCATRAAFGCAAIASAWLAIRAALGLVAAPMMPACGIAFVWPVVDRLLLAWLWRREVGRVRWLVLGSRDCLTQVWRDRLVNPHMGDFVLLCREAIEVGAEGPFPVSGGWDSLDLWLPKPWTGILVADQVRLPEPVLKRLMAARLAGVPVRSLSEFYERYWNKVPIYHLHDGWFTFSDGFQLLHDSLTTVLKRLLDVMCAVALLIASAPLLPLVALTIRVCSPGPVLFRQVRVGQRGQPFTVYKFRSMHIDAEKDGPRWASTNDPRAFAFGRFLRKTRVDEIPQLFNVLVGNMSIIGPRPERPEFVRDLENEIPYFALRHTVKPGLTGWAQVNYPYGASIEDAREKLQYDLFYIKNQSLRLDLLILIKTVRVVLCAIGGR